MDAAHAEVLHDWALTPLGAHLLAQEQAYFDSEVADVFGFNAFQFGFTARDFLRANRMPCRGLIGMDNMAKVRADVRQLPIMSGSVDLVVLPHVLEFSDNPHQVLREVARILMPEGHVIIAGFNPWSLWGVRQILGGRRDTYPWQGQFINLPRLKDWMALLGFELAAGRMCCYLPPVTSQKWLRRLEFLDAAGDRWWPFAGGVYFLHAVKRVAGLRVITPQWKGASAKSKRLAAVSHRITERDEQLAARIRGAHRPPQ